MSIATTPSPALPAPSPPTLPEVPPLLSAGLTCETRDGRVREHVNLDHAATTSAFVEVKDAVDEATVTYGSVHRGNGYLSRVTSARYEAAREIVGTFVGKRSEDHVVFTRNTTDSFNLLARVVPGDASVFVFDSDHHATVLPWREEQLHRLGVPTSVEDALARLHAGLLADRATDRLVVVTGASNVTGEYWPVAEVVALAKRFGARVALDAAQLVQHRAVDIAAEGVDYVAFSGHKVYAPYGAGVLVGRGDWLDDAAPYLAGGGATQVVTSEETRWHCGPARHEAGSPNVLGAVGLAAACQVIERERASIDALESDLGRGLISRLDAIPGVRTLSLFGPTHERAPVVTFTVDGWAAEEVSRVLAEDHGIGVRDGRFCAHILVDALLERRRSAHTSAVRASLGLANTPAHVDQLVAAVRKIASR